MAEGKLQDLSHTHRTAAEAVQHAIIDLKAVLTAPRYKYKVGSHTYLEKRRDMPYVISDISSMPGAQILVNRQYKPVGSNLPTGAPFVEYEDYPNLHTHLTAEQIAKVVSPGHERGLFGDVNAPWAGRKEAEAYLRRLWQLFSYLDLGSTNAPTSGI